MSQFHLPDSRDLTAFIAVAEEMSFRKAADRLDIDQSVLSRRIRQFEDAIGFQLFFRTTRDVSLTEAGRILLARGKFLVNDLAQAVSDAQRAAEGRSGLLRLAYMSFAATKLMPDIVRRYTALYPEIALEISYLSTTAQKRAILRDEIDAGFLLGPLDDPSLDSIALTREGLRLVMRSDHPLAHRATITMQNVASCQLVLGNANEWDFFRALIDKPFAKKGLKLNITYEASNTMGILGLVAGGLGQTIYVDSITRIQPEGLVSRSISDCDASITTALAWRRGHQTPIIRNLIAAARSNLSAPARLG